MIIEHQCDDNLPLDNGNYVDSFSFQSDAKDFADNNYAEILDFSCIDSEGNEIDSPDDAWDKLETYLLDTKYNYFLERLCGY